MVATDDGSEEGGGGPLFTIGISVPNVPQFTVLGHCLAADFESRSQLEVLQVTAPGVPDLPAATPHFVVVVSPVPVLSVHWYRICPSH